MKHIKIYFKVNDLPDSWNELAVNDIFLRTTFLKGLEYSYPENISAYYVGLFKDEKLIGIAVLQRVKMYLESIFRDNSTWIKQQTTALISKIVKGNILVLGNLMHTGQHGFNFNSEALNYSEFLELVYQGIDEVSNQIKMEFGKTIRIITFKDYFLDDEIHNQTEFFKSKKLYQVQVQPNMVFNLNPDWNNTEDYKIALNKKYRKRYTTALKKKRSIISKPLTLEEIKVYEETVFKLYKSVSDNAGVNSFVLPKRHFYELKKALGNQFILNGYFLNEELLGFFTLIENKTILETYFLGYNSKLNHKHQIYLNMLYDMIDYGVTSSFKSIVFARTAMEIKSSVGAKPNPMVLYVKHTNSFFANKILKLILKYLNPLKPWQERNPFK
ncbi:GNAT family N-acetyltransferase [Aurantibacter sp.]|uniref:GNAT family N-acetyltransferase n=1 Tax=Aurantibacter sp. TaxID=2807103 RepID=UPI0035C7D4B3